MSKIRAGGRSLLTALCVLSAYATTPCPGQTPFANSLNHSYAVGPTVFDFVDISRIGDRQSPGDDGVVRDIPIGFGFTFFGDTRTEIDLQGNGHLALDSGDNSYPGAANGAHPEPFGGLIHENYTGGIIAGLWDDFDHTQGGAVYTATTGSPGSQVFIAQFDDVPRFATGPNGDTFQMKLFQADSSIEFHYLDWDSPVDHGEAIGISYNQTQYLQWSFNQPQAPGTAIRFETDPGFSPRVFKLEVDPDGGSVFISNASDEPVDLKGYTISSASGSLNEGDAFWQSLSDMGIAGPGWAENTNASANNLTETNFTESFVLLAGQKLPLGRPFTAGGVQDLVFEFLAVDEDPLQAFVQYFIDGSIAGDVNGDGRVNIDDLNSVRNNFGSVGLDDGTLPGDAFPFDGIVDIGDLNGVRNNFGSMATAVPEPGTLVLWAAGGFAALLLSGRRHLSCIGRFGSDNPRVDFDKGG